MSETVKNTDLTDEEKARLEYAANLQRELALNAAERYKATLLDELRKGEVTAGFAGKSGAVVDIYPGQGGRLPFTTAKVGGEDYDVVSTISVTARDQEVGPNNPAGYVFKTANQSRGTLAMLRHPQTKALSAVAISEDELASGAFDIAADNPDRPIHSFVSPNNSPTDFSGNIKVGADPNNQWEAPATLTITQKDGVFTVGLDNALGAQAIVMQPEHRHDLARG